MRFESMNAAAVSASAAVLQTFTKPALPRPPAWTWALTTTMPAPPSNRRFASAAAS
jgi:hypothetical protein